MWVVDWTANKIFAYNMRTKARDAAKDFETLAAAGNTLPSDLWGNADTMWVLQLAGNMSKIFAYNMNDKEHDPTQDFDTLVAAGNDRPTGIWSDGTTMWVANENLTEQIYAYDMTSKMRLVDTPPNTDRTDNEFPTLPGTMGFLENIWANDDTMWVVSIGTVNIEAYDRASKGRDTAKDFGGFALAGPRGIWSNGTTMWVSDSTWGSILAYRVSDKMRDP